MKLQMLAVGLATVLCAAFSQVQGQGHCIRDACIPNQLKVCGGLYPGLPVEKMPDLKSQGSCVYTEGTSKFKGTRRVCCATEQDYTLMRVNDLLGDLTGAETGEYPHQVELKGDGDSCGATIYNDEWIITAAHCIFLDGINKTKGTIEKGYVIAGQTDLENAGEEDKHYFQNIIIHEWWNSTNALNGSDIALLHLRADSKLKFVKGKIQPLRVEPREFKPQYGGKALVMGFGYASKYGGARHLQEAEVPIHEPTKAARLSFDPLNADSHPAFGGLPPTSQHLAVAGDDSGYTVGKGDSGGPVICADEQGKPVLCGVASFKICDEKKVCKRPSYFLRVAPFLDWIKLKTNGATQPKEWLVDEPMFPVKLTEEDIPGYLVRLTSGTKTCMGTMIATDRLITSHECITEITGNDPNLIPEKINIYHFKSKRVLKLVVPSGNPNFSGNVSSKIYEYLNRPLGINDGYLLVVKPEVGIKDVLDLPPSRYSINSPAVEYTMNEKTFSVETRRYLTMDRQLCERKMNALDPNLKLDSSQLCMRRVYSAERECDRDVGGPLVCEGKYFCGQKSFHGCHLSAFPEIFNNHLDANYRGWLDSMKAAVID